MQVSSLPREAGTSIGKKADGECKKEIVSVSELGDQGLGLVLLLSGKHCQCLQQPPDQQK